MKNTQGIVLVTVMTFLLVLTLLAIGALDASVLAIKQSAQQWQFWHARQAAISANKRQNHAVERGQSLKCSVSFSINDHYWQRDPTFWLSQPACITRDATISSYSVVEKLPDTLCQINANNQTIEFAFYRITTFTQSTHAAQFLVQSIITQSAISQKTCHNPEARVSLGLQSWRME